MIRERLSTFAGLPVHTFDGDPEGGPRPAEDEVAWGIYHRIQDNGAWGAEVPENFELFLRTVDTARVTHLVIGFWGFDTEEFDPVGRLVEAAGRFPDLRAVFLGDIRDWDLHISWIRHSDVSPLFAAFPGLEHVGIRGGDGLRLEPMRAPRLRTLRFEAARLPEEVVGAVAASDLPGLERLDMWLGQYLMDAPPLDELAGIWTGERLPALRRLGLENADCADEIAEALAGAPVVARLESLSLAMGTLTDRGAEALLSGQPLTHLKELDLHHHFLSEEMTARVRAGTPGVQVNLDEGQGPPRRSRGRFDITTYIAVAE
ncbi:STM4015 family protein [Actinomadura formosensis]|uniref:STM4015 family protein n=1 Tax=Actinomadura formosensis TaxID=60706 RepID=UPI003D8CE79B